METTGYQDRRHCPYCAEMILRDAKVCRFCGREVEPLLAPTEVTPLAIDNSFVRCPVCQTKNYLTADRCDKCGIRFLVPISPPPKKAKPNEVLMWGRPVPSLAVIIIGGCCIGLFLVAGILGQLRSQTDQPTTNNPPSVNNSGQDLTFLQITNSAKQLTEIKRNDYYKSLVGENIHWTGKVADVTNSGEVRVRIVSTVSYDVAVQGIPRTTYTSLNLNDVITFDGTITEVTDLFGSGIPQITVEATSAKTN